MAQSLFHKRYKLYNMKKTMFVTLFCAASMMLFAQHHRYDRNNPPDVVVKSYQKDYRTYNNNPTWDMQNNQWHTRYKDRDSRDVDVYYDTRGRRVQTGSEWDRDRLPMRVRERLIRRYPHENYTVYRIERPGRGIFFQITLSGNRKIYMDERGREVRYY